MQPLTYQSAEDSCWIACMVNGIRLVTDRDRVPTTVYRKLHSLLQDKGEDKGVFYYEPNELEALEAVNKEVNGILPLNVYYRCRCRVKIELLELQFNRGVVVCDIGDGDHSILLHNRTGDWFEGFDPYWYGEERCGSSVLKFPKGNPTVNVKIHKRHLFSPSVNDKARRKGQEYHMGANEWRFCTIIRSDYT